MPGNQDAVSFDQLTNADLIVDQVYLGGSAGNSGDDPLAKLLPVGNQGGFRWKGSPKNKTVQLTALYTSGREPDWPDDLDLYTGVFTYYGDNRKPGHTLENTPRQGNLLLSNIFEWAHGEPAERAKVPPFLLFEKVSKTRAGRDIQFRGLLAPGSDRLGGEEDLVAIWRTTSGKRFQNYRAYFTVLDEAKITRAWINQILAGEPLGSECPHAWLEWVQSGTYRPLQAPPTIIVRTREQQLPLSADQPLLDVVYGHFKDDPHAFEQFAADLWKMTEPHVDKIDVTRPSRDGGRDAIGDYLIGPPSDPVAVEFALEAKCYGPNSSVGVREASRLISRLLHRQFGVLVTTSFVHKQAYEEIRNDGHPVIILSGRDIVDILKNHDKFNTVESLTKLLLERYPVTKSAN